MDMTRNRIWPCAACAASCDCNEPMAAHSAGAPAARRSAATSRPTSPIWRSSCGACDDEPVYFVGLGSNLLVRDGGLRGTVMLLHGALNHIKLARPHGLVYAEAGVASPKVARFAASHDLRGAEFLAGIPGTVGGALAMNAGCYGGETWECVRRC